MKQVKSLITEICVIRDNRDDYNIFTTDEAWNLDMVIHKKDHTGFIQVGDNITVQNKKYLIERVSFRLNPKPSDIQEGIDIYNEDNSQGMYNCSVLVSVKEV